MSSQANRPSDQEPTIGQPLNPPGQRPQGKAFMLTLVFIAALVLGYLAGAQWLIR